MKKELQKLEKERNTLSLKINKIIEEEENSVQIPRCKTMVGWCLKSTYNDNRYGRLLEVIECKEYGLYFLMEEFYVNKGGECHIYTTTCYPYLNKEWWNEEVPISGWKKITENEYWVEKAKMWNEFTSMNRLRNFILKNK